MFLDRIVNQTKLDLEQHKRDLPLEELKRLAFEQPGPRDMLAAFQPRSQVQLIAEVKRASPSKGLLAPELDPVEIARAYEANGAAVISVLTEPHFFLGAPEYLTAIKAEVSIPVLRKDFIVDEYQVYQARAWGADALLLICAILDDQQLRHLHAVANQLRMRCLVEVHTQEEARRAVAAGALIIGVNSRDLTTFKLNPYLIREIRQSIPATCLVIAESGIQHAADARRIARSNVQGMLVGESLVVAKDLPRHMQELLSGANESTQIKICGLSTPEHIDTAVEAGADLLGLIFHEPSHRYVPPQQVAALLAASQRYQQPASDASLPDLVGVFVNKEAAYINDVVEQAGLHFVQLHGTESPEFCQSITRPVIKALHLHDETAIELARAYQAVTWRLLLDTPTPEWGGTGETHDWRLAQRIARSYPLLLAGGLTVENVAEAIQQVRPWGIDVSSGVETNKQKDSQKIRAFIEAARVIPAASRHQ